MLGAVREGDDSAFVYRMLLAAHAAAPSPEVFAERLARLRSGRTNRYAMAEAELSADPPTEPAAPAEFLSRGLFHLAEFEALAPDAFLAAAFAACLRRAPDPFAAAHYDAMLAGGRATRAEIIRQLLQSDEARLGGTGCVVIGLAPPGDDGPVIQALADLHRRDMHLEYLAAFLQAQLQGLAARLARLERRG